MTRAVSLRRLLLVVWNRQDVAINLATFFQKAVVETSPFFQQQSERSGREIDALDIVGELVTGTTTCHDLGDQAFRFFEASQRTPMLGYEAVPSRV